MRTHLLICAVLGTGTAATAATTVQWGSPGDIPVPGDFDGDGRADYTVFRPSNGHWYVLSSASLTFVRDVQHGQLGDIPVPYDYDNDGRIDYGVFRPSTGVWLRKRGTDSFDLPVVQWGQAGDIPMPGDYDGDGRTDLAVFRPSTGYWYINNVAMGSTRYVQWGQSGDIPMHGDFDMQRGDDIVVWRPSTGQWFVINGLSYKLLQTQQWGWSSDVPVGSRFCTETATRTVWRRGQASWWTLGQPVVVFGGTSASDSPVPANYIGDSVDDLATYNSITGIWTVQESACDRKWGMTQALINNAPYEVRGITVAAVKNGAIVYTAAAGYANDTTPATPDIPFQIASISKLFIGTALIKAADMGLVSLTAPSGLQNPNPPFYSLPTITHLATHTSGVKTETCYSIGNFEPTRDLQQIFGCLSGPVNAWKWNPVPAGTDVAYSNAAAAWGARVVEQRTGIDFDTFTSINIFYPLQMYSSKWFLGQFSGPVSVGYDSGFHRTFTSGVTPYAMGNLRASANDLARFMIMWLNDGVGSSGQRVLASGRTGAALTNLLFGNGFFWDDWKTRSQRPVWAHGGVINPGVCTRLSIDNGTHTGVVILTNTSCDAAGPYINAIEDRAFQALDLP